MKYLKTIGGIILIATLITIITGIAYIPTWLISPESKTAQTICYFIFLSIFIVEICFLVIILATYAKSKREK